MKLINAIAVALLMQVTVYAGTESCVSKNVVLSCKSSYQLIAGYDQTPIGGPEGNDEVSERQPEPFDPSMCQASVALFTYAGRFVATYSENGSVYAWLETDGKTQFLVTDKMMSLKLPLELTVKSPLKGIVNSVTFTCSLSSK